MRYAPRTPANSQSQTLMVRSTVAGVALALVVAGSIAGAAAGQVSPREAVSRGAGGSTSAAIPTRVARATVASVASRPNLAVVPAAARPVVQSAFAPASQTLTSSTSGQVAAARVHGVVANRIIIRRLRINLPVVRGNGVSAPLGKAAHYPGTGWPGGGTNIYLYAHARDGMFINLWKAKIGDTIVLRLVNGKSAVYKVVRILRRVPWNADRYLMPTKSERLTLQTCTSFRMTSPRFLVIATPQT